MIYVKLNLSRRIDSDHIRARYVGLVVNETNARTLYDELQRVKVMYEPSPERTQVMRYIAALMRANRLYAYI